MGPSAPHAGPRADGAKGTTNPPADRHDVADPYPLSTVPHKKLPRHEPIDRTAFDGVPGAIGWPKPRVRTPSKGLPRRNEERLRKRRAAEFGEHSDWICTLPCCACRPELYRRADLIGSFAIAGRRVSDPHHVRTRGSGAGEASDCAPLCRHHHTEIDSPGWGTATFGATYGIDLHGIARMLWDISPARKGNP